MFEHFTSVACGFSQPLIAFHSPKAYFHVGNADTDTDTDCGEAVCAAQVFSHNGDGARQTNFCFRSNHVFTCHIWNMREEMA
jgi:hypothetical protein